MPDFGPLGTLETDAYVVRFALNATVLGEITFKTYVETAWMPSRHIEPSTKAGYQPLMAALALSDEHPPLSDPQVLGPQPENLTPTQSAEHHRGHHRGVPVSAQSRSERVDLSRCQDPRQPPGPPGPPGQRPPCPGRERSRLVGRPRGTGFAVMSPRTCR